MSSKYNHRYALYRSWVCDGAKAAIAGMHCTYHLEREYTSNIFYKDGYIIPMHVVGIVFTRSLTYRTIVDKGVGKQGSTVIFVSFLNGHVFSICKPLYSLILF